MTSRGFNLTFQMFQEETAITERLAVESFELEWEVDRIAEISGMEPPRHVVQQMRFGDLHFVFPEVNELPNVALHYVRPDVAIPLNPRPTIKVEIGRNNWVEYHDTTLVSLSYSNHEEGPPKLEATWRFRDASGTMPRNQMTISRELPPMQKLDWKQLGF
jgi:hypothetical protein